MVLINVAVHFNLCFKINKQKPSKTGNGDDTEQQLKSKEYKVTSTQNSVNPQNISLPKY